MKISFEISESDAGRAKALAHAMNTYNKQDPLCTSLSEWTPQKIVMAFGTFNLAENLKKYQEFIFD